jgi:hypothetical protein
VRTEHERAARWFHAWMQVLMQRSRKDCIRWQKRSIWAMHRLVRARRAEAERGPRCSFCEFPGHDESEEPCAVRTRSVGRWEQCGRIWRGEEAGE